MSKRERVTEGVRGVFILLTLKNSRWTERYPATPGYGSDTLDTRTIRAEVRTNRTQLTNSLMATSFWILCDKDLSLVLLRLLEH